MNRHGSGFKCWLLIV